MSRPSRGFSVAITRTNVNPSCPASSELAINPLQADDWLVIVDWSPGINVPDLILNYRVNGGAWSVFQHDTDQVPAVNYDPDPQGLGGAGDFLEFQASLQNMPGCSDILSNIVGGTIL